MPAEQGADPSAPVSPLSPRPRKIYRGGKNNYPAALSTAIRAILPPALTAVVEPGPGGMAASPLPGSEFPPPVQGEDPAREDSGGGGSDSASSVPRTKRGWESIGGGTGGDDSDRGNTTLDGVATPPPTRLGCAASSGDISGISEGAHEDRSSKRARGFE